MGWAAWFQTRVRVQQKVWVRLGVLALTALFLFELSYHLPLYTPSERFHFVVALLWLIDLGVFQRPSRTRWLILGGTAFGLLVTVWSLFAQQAQAIGGRLNWGEPFWYLLFLASLAAIYEVLRLGLARLTARVCKTPSRGVSAWLQVFVTVLLFLPYAYTACNIHRGKIGTGTDPQRAYGLPYESVRFTAADDGVPLSGWFVPGRPGAPTVLICHGIGANKGNFLSFAPFLHRAGFHVFLFDFRAHGDSAGHTTSFGDAEARDVRGAVRYLTGRPDVRGIAAFGLSMGGAALLHAIPRLPAMRAVIVDSTFADFGAVTDGQLAALPTPVRGVMRAEIGLWARLELGVPLTDIAPKRYIAAVSPRPLLIIHGTGDALIPPAQAAENFAAARPPKQMWLVPGAGHVGAHSVAREEYERRVLAFLRGHAGQERRREAPMKERMGCHQKQIGYEQNVSHKCCIMAERGHRTAKGVAMKSCSLRQPQAKQNSRHCRRRAAESRTHRIFIASLFAFCMPFVWLGAWMLRDTSGPVLQPPDSPAPSTATRLALQIANQGQNRNGPDPEATLASMESYSPSNADQLRARYASAPASNPTTTHYVYDGQNMVREMQPGTDGQLHPTATYLSGPRGPEYRRDDTTGQVRWYVYDGLGSVVGEIDPA